MLIAENKKVVSVTYDLISNKNQQLIESVGTEKPLVFIMGAGNLLPKFEDNLSGKKVGDSFDFILSAEDAYGVFSPDAIVDVPMNVFESGAGFDKSMLEIGQSVPMMDRDGNRFNGIIKEIASESVKMDFNHPLAGEDLHFKGNVVDLREATEEELSHGHIHQDHSCGDGGCGDCGDGGGSCSGGCH